MPSPIMAAPSEPRSESQSAASASVSPSQPQVPYRPEIKSDSHEQPLPQTECLSQDSSWPQFLSQAQSPSQDESHASERSPSPQSPSMDSDFPSDAERWHSTLLAPSDFAGSETVSPGLTDRHSIDTGELAASPALADRDGIGSAATSAAEGFSPAIADRVGFFNAAAATAAADTESPAGLNSLLTTPLSRGSSILSPLTPPSQRTALSHTVIRALPFPSLASPPPPTPLVPPSGTRPPLMETQPEGVEAWAALNESRPADVGLEEKPSTQEWTGSPSTPKARVGYGILEAGSRLRDQAGCTEDVPGYLEAPFESRASSEGSTGSVCGGTVVLAAEGATVTAAGAAAVHAASASRQASGRSGERETDTGEAEDRAQGGADYMGSVAKRRAFFEHRSGQSSAREDPPEGWRAGRSFRGTPPEHPEGSQGSGSSHRIHIHSGASSNDDRKSDDSIRSHNSSDSRGSGTSCEAIKAEGERHAKGGPVVSSQGGYYEEESESSSSSCCTSRLRTEEGALVGEEEAPGALLTVAESHGAGLTRETTDKELTGPGDAGEVVSVGKPDMHGTLVTEGGIGLSQDEEGGFDESQVAEEGAQAVGEALAELPPLPCDRGVVQGGVEESQVEDTRDRALLLAEGLAEAALNEEWQDESKAAEQGLQLAREGPTEALATEERLQESQDGSRESQVAEAGELAAATFAEAALTEELAENDEEGEPGLLAPGAVTSDESQVTKGGAVPATDGDETVPREEREMDQEESWVEVPEDPLHKEEGGRAVAQGMASAQLHLVRDSASTCESSELPALIDLRSTDAHVSGRASGELEPAEVVSAGEGHSLLAQEGAPGGHSDVPLSQPPVTVTALTPRSHSARLLHTFKDGAGAPVVCLDKDSSSSLLGGAAVIPIVTRDCRVCSEVTTLHKVEHEPDTTCGIPQAAYGIPLISRCTNSINNCSSRYRLPEASHKVACQPTRKTALPCWAPPTTFRSSLSTNISRSTVDRAAEGGVASSVAGSVQLAHHWLASGIPVVGRNLTLQSDSLGAHQPPVYPGLTSGEWLDTQEPSAVQAEPEHADDASIHREPATGETQGARALSLHPDASARSSEDVRDAGGAPALSDELLAAERSPVQPGAPEDFPGREGAEEEAWGLGLSLGVAGSARLPAGEQVEGWELVVQGAQISGIGASQRVESAPAAHAVGASRGIGSLTCDSPLGLRLEPPGPVTPAAHQLEEPPAVPGAGHGAGAAPSAGVGAGPDAEAGAAAGTWAGARGSPPDLAVVVEIDLPSFQAGEAHAEGTPAVYQGAKGVGKYQVPPSEWDAVFPSILATPAPEDPKGGGLSMSPRSLFLKLQSPEVTGPSDEEERTEQYSRECKGPADKQYDRGRGAKGAQEGRGEAVGETAEGDGEEGGGFGETEGAMQEEAEDLDDLWSLLQVFQATRYVETTAAFGLVARVAPQISVAINKATEVALIGVLMSFSSVLIATLVNSASQDAGFLPS